MKSNDHRFTTHGTSPRRHAAMRPAALRFAAPLCAAALLLLACAGCGAESELKLTPILKPTPTPTPIP